MTIYNVGHLVPLDFHHISLKYTGGCRFCVLFVLVKAIPFHK